MSRLYLLFVILVLVFVGERVNCVKIQFFKNKNFKGLNYESSSTAKCNNVPANKSNVEIHSIKTDTCLMVYYYPNCIGESRKFDLDNALGWKWKVESFHICNEDIGGPQLKIDITTFYDYYKPTELPDVLISYRDVCSCVNVPIYGQNMTRWSVNNYGNDFLAYFEADCYENKWKPKLIPAGYWGDEGSRYMYYHKNIDSATNTTYNVQSIGPDPNSKYFKSSCKPVTMYNKIINTVRENENQIVSLRNDLRKYDSDFLNGGAKNEELEKQVQCLLKENEALKEKMAANELRLENQYRNLEDSVEKLKVEFSYFIHKINER